MFHNNKLIIIFTICAFVYLTCSCREHTKVTKAKKTLKSSGEEEKYTPICPYADKIYKVDSHINMSPEAVSKVLKLNEQWGVKASINVMGGWTGNGLEESQAIVEETKGKIQFMCNIDWSIFGKDYFIKVALKDIENCKQKGGIGIKIFKSLGLSIRWPDGKLLRVDDPILDPIFEKAGELGLPILIHSGDPKAFFKPLDKNNERYEELMAHPSWHFYGKDYPSWEEIYKQFENRVARHPNTIFIGSHFGNNPEDPPAVFAMLDKYPNLFINTSARIPEIGRFDPKAMHNYFIKYKERIIYGSDLGVGRRVLILGSSPPVHPTEKEINHFFISSYRYFETWDKNFDHPTPIQGKWKISGIALPCDVLEYIYHKNAERIFNLKIQ